MIKQGRPTVLIANENFVEAVERISAASEVPHLPYVVFPTNIDSLPEAEIVALAEARLEEIVTKLLHQSEASLLGATGPR